MIALNHAQMIYIAEARGSLFNVFLTKTYTLSHITLHKRPKQRDNHSPSQKSEVFFSSNFDHDKLVFCRKCWYSFLRF